MFGYLKQSTASQSRLVGPFVDDTDFKTLETSLTINNTDVKLSKNGAAGVNKNSGGGTHRNNGMYSLTFDATDTDTVGELTGSISVSGALVVVFKFWILEEDIYDALFGASAAGFDSNQRVDVGSVGGTAQTANDNGADINAILTDTNELQTDLTNGGRLDLILDELTSQGDTNEGKLDIITTDTDELQTDWTNGGRLDLIIDELTSQGDTNEGKIDTIDGNVDSILIDTGTTLENHLTDIKGTGFVKDTNSLVDLPLSSDYSAARAGYLDELAAANIPADLDNVLADTNELQTDDVPGLIGALNDLSAADVNAEVDTALNTAVPGSPTADSINERVKALDDLISSSKLPAQVKGIDAGTIVAASFGAGAIDASALAADAVDEILDEVVEGTLTLRQILRIALSVLGGISNGGGGTTLNFRDVADSKNRVQATVDANGNRTAVTLDGT